MISISRVCLAVLITVGVAISNLLGFLSSQAFIDGISTRHDYLDGPREAEQDKVCFMIYHYGGEIHGETGS